ncbi:MAG: hypothetical protein ACERKS_11970, partial [Candidatus Bathyarchaeota archaeon]
MPSSSHYVETIEVRIDGEVYEIDLDPQTETVFEVEIMLEDVDLTFFEVRVKCISHGWSSWASFGVEEPVELTRQPIGQCRKQPVEYVVFAGQRHRRNSLSANVERMR